MSTVPDICVSDAAEAAATGSVLLLDVREDDEWAAGHVRGSLHMPLGSLDPSGLPADVPVVVVCRSGNRSAKAAAVLAQAGVDAVNMAGGMNAWVAAGMPVLAADGSPGEIA